MPDDKPTVWEYTDPYVAAYTPPPAYGIGVCDVCHGAPTSGYARCLSCKRTIDSVSRPLTLVVPVSHYRVGEQLHTVLGGYKRSSNEDVRRRHLLQVGATLHRFVFEHGDCIRAAAGREWDTVTNVPSKQPRTGRHPLEQAIALGQPLASQYERLLEPDEADSISRTQGSDRGFRTIDNVEGKRVLLVDDTFTSGATFQSAASRLALDGADVVAGVVLGRVINPDFNDETRELWERQRAIAFDFATCCIHAG